jgi:saccharopine dehydrogenase-like NADP-dependent oxidoreductase
MKNILVAGAGHIGAMIAELLVSTGDYQVTIADQSERALAAVPKRPNLDTLLMSVTDRAELVAAMRGRYAVISAAPYSVTAAIAAAAHAAGIHYLDLTEDVATTRRRSSIVRRRDVCVPALDALRMRTSPRCPAHAHQPSMPSAAS